MRVAIMQPYFLPYIGYYQLMAAVDVFVVYDNIEYTKKGWINRNRMLVNGQDAIFSLPLKKDSDYLSVCQRELATDFSRSKLLNQFRGAYSKAPQFAAVWPLLHDVVQCPEQNLFDYLHHAISKTATWLGLTASLRVSSTIKIDHQLKGQNKVLALCEALGAKTYVNAIGGTDLYDHASFAARGIHLKFVRSAPFEYAQLGAPFVPWLSIIDVLMFNSLERVQEQIRTGYALQ